MNFVVDALHYIVPFLIVLTVLVFVHEMGHFLVARWNGVRVEVFSIGFGPEILGWTDRRRTRWKISALPLGGYVKMFGDANAASAPAEGLEEMTAEERAVSFQHKSVARRAAVVVAGPAANFVFAILVFAVLFYCVGQPFTSPVVGQVDPGSAAARAGFEPGDRIVQIGNQKIDRFEQVQRIVQFGLDEPLKVQVQRGDKLVSLNAVPEIVTQRDNFGNSYEMGRLGLRSSGIEYLPCGPATALQRAVQETGFLTAVTLKGVGQMIAGKRTTEELGGPLRIAEMSGKMAQGGVVSTVWFLAVLSLNLGLINLFPIPMLDGGHLLFYAIEAVRRRPLGPRIQEYGFRIGFTLVLLLMIFATWNDLVHLKVVQFVAGLIS
jgi:regulator of sigma E protease